MLGALAALFTAAAVAAPRAEAQAPPATYFGMTAPGARVAVLVDGVECASVVANPDGSWQVEVGAGACAPAFGETVTFTLEGSISGSVAWQPGGAVEVALDVVLRGEPGIEPPEPPEAPVPTPPAPEEPPEQPVETFDVDSEVDRTDGSPGDGTCAAREAHEQGSGACTLRAAIQEANASDGATLVRLSAGTYVLAKPGAEENDGATGDLDIAGDFELAGAGSDVTVVDAAGLDRVFHVLSGAVTLSGLTITGGYTDSNLSGGAGVRNEAELTLRDVVVLANSSLEDGGGIENAGTLVLSDSEIRDNSAGDLGGGVATGQRGLSPDATVVIERSTIAGNDSTAGGGGIATNGALTLRESTVSENADGGGAIYAGTGGTAVIENSTISGNDAVGLFILDGTADVTSSTFAENDGGEGAPGIVNASDPAGTGSVTVTGSILADGCSGAVASGGGNVDTGGTCGLEAPGDQSGVDPWLGPLAENGGPTLTHAPLDGSPAIDAAGATGPETDQRGVARPQGAAFDSGAVEVEAESTPQAEGIAEEAVAP